MQVPNRDVIERKLARLLGRQFRDQIDELMDLLGDPPNPTNIPVNWWDKISKNMRIVMFPVMVDIFIQQVSAFVEKINIGVDWALANEWAINWGNKYTFELVAGITDRTREVISKSMEAFWWDGLSVSDFANMLEPTFGPARAATIAVTETTRAAVQGELAVVNYIEIMLPNVEMIAIWQTVNDEAVCDICGPRNQTTAEEGGWEGDEPPAHPNCRCWLNYEMTVKE